MPKRQSKARETKGQLKQETWHLDQLAKSKLFHRLLHKWQLVEIAEEIETLQGEKYEWDCQKLGINERAWQKVIHRGVKPVQVFTHPKVLRENPKRIVYYRMLAMVSQKSMSNLGFAVENWETGRWTEISEEQALKLACHLNEIISEIICEDEQIIERELDLWRGMAAGAQAQGTWQNIKGTRAEQQIYDLVRGFIANLGSEGKRKGEFVMHDGRRIVLRKDPDIAVYRSDKIEAAAEIKGGIDPAGALERLGAALKTLERIQRKCPEASLILVAPRSAMTRAFLEELKQRPQIYLFALEDLLTSEQEQQRFLHALKLLSSADSNTG